MKYNSTRSDRIDTTVTQVRVIPGTIGSREGAAVAYVREQIAPDAVVLAVWREPGPRLPGGDGIVYNVEWEDADG